MRSNLTLHIHIFVFLYNIHCIHYILSLHDSEVITIINYFYFRIIHAIIQNISINTYHYIMHKIHHRKKFYLYRFEISYCAL